jgi:signal transduction histidine kinase/ActR/RegA family two-component response regulator
LCYNPPVRIRSHLLLLTVVVLVPGFFAAAIAVDKVREGERQATLAALRETVRAAALLVDGQVQRSLGALTALASSPNLQTGDLKAFYEEAKTIDDPPDVWTLLLDETGAQKVNTNFPFGTPLPIPSARERVALVLATQRPLVTDVFPGPATGKLLTTIYLPAAPTPNGRYVVAQAFAVDHWRTKALQPQVRSDWVVGVIDRQGKFISRSHRADELLGRNARAELVAAAAASNEGLIRHSTLEGVPVYDAFTHSTLTGWTIAVAAPVETIEATATQAIVWLAAGLAAALLVALFGASLLSRLLIHAIGTASAGARALGTGAPANPVHTSVDEINELNIALVEVAHLLTSERSAREEVEKQRVQWLEDERSAKEKAQDENAAKDKFLALLGHELRNPLSAIVGATEILARKPADVNVAERFVAMIQRQNRHLTHIVNDLLETSRMLSGKIVLESSALDLGECVGRCVEALRSTDWATHHKLVMHSHSVCVLGDPVRIEQIVNNLVTNAAKFSDPNSQVDIRVQAAGNWAVLRVSDVGAGIAPELQPHIFKPFVQGPSLPGKAQSGLGVGLALVKQLVSLHGGQVRAEPNRNGRGTTFVVMFPRIDSGADSEKSTQPLPATAGRVLLVEDNVDARESTAELLRLLGYDVVEAEDGPQALEAALAHAFDIAIMDLGLPGLSGFEIATEFKKEASLRNVPLIALSGYGQQRDKEAALAAGFDEHLVKPVEPDCLSQTIQNCINARLTLDSSA